MRRCTRLRSGKKYINVDEPDDAAEILSHIAIRLLTRSAGDSPLDIY
jgi:hypothetical protein